MSSTSLPPFDPQWTGKDTQPPFPEWRVGQGVPDTTPNGKQWNEDAEKGWKTWDLAETGPLYVFFHENPSTSQALTTAL